MQTKWMKTAVLAWFDIPPDFLLKELNYILLCR